MANIEASVANFFSTTLTGAISASDLTIPVDDIGSLTSPCYIVIEPASDSKREVILADGTWGASSFVCSDVADRGLAGSAAGAQSHDSGATVTVVPLAQHLQDLHDRLEAHQAAFDADHGSDHDGRDHSGLTGIPVVVTAVKTADETVNNSTTLQDDDHLAVSLEASSTYAVDAFLDIDASATAVGVTFKAGLSVPSGATVSWGILANSNSAGNGESLDEVGGAGGQRSHGGLRGYVITSDTAGDLQLQWAQEVAEASDLTLKSGSWLRVEKIA